MNIRMRSPAARSLSLSRPRQILRANNIMSEPAEQLEEDMSPPIMSGEDANGNDGEMMLATWPKEDDEKAAASALSGPSPSSGEEQQQEATADAANTGDTTTTTDVAAATDANNNSSPKEKKKKQAVLAPLPLDWTKMAECTEGTDPQNDPTNPLNIVRHPWDVTSINPSEPYLTIVGTHGQKITRMGSKLYTKVSPKISELTLRSHLIRTMEGIGGMKCLETLELYDNMVDELRELDGSYTTTTSGGGNDGEDNGEQGGVVVVKGDGLPGKNLRVLDISYNVIRDMGPVSFCPNLQELYIAQNKIKSIKGLKSLKLLRKIDLGANRIRVMDEEELSGLTNLEELWLGKNKIEHIDGISKLTKLRRLDVQSNRLTRIENLQGQVDTLEELYLAHNGIDVEGAKCETGLALPFTQLNTVDLSRNRLADTSPFAHLKCLSDLWISGNDIKTFDDVDTLKNLTELDGVYLEYNPVASEFEYRKKLAELIPSLTQIDANMIGGIAQHGYMSAGGAGSGENLVERMKQMQEVAIQKAKAEEEDEEEKKAAAAAAVVEDDNKAAADESETAGEKSEE